jgi:predicted HTH transcriptional regulator
MKTADLDILLQEGEGAMLEYKEGLSSSFARELVAFANTAGGRILLGVRDDGTIKGIVDTNQLRACIQDIARNCDPPVIILLQRIRDEARVQGCPEPLFEETGFVTATFFPNPEVRAQVGAQPAGATEQIGTKSALSRHQVEILEKCQEERALLELMAVVGRSDRTKFRHQVLNPLIDAGLIEMTIPDKPRSPKQRYQTTEAGRCVLENSDKESQS